MKAKKPKKKAIWAKLLGLLLLFGLLGSLFWFFTLPMLEGTPLDVLLCYYRLKLFGPDVLPRTLYIAYAEGKPAIPLTTVQWNPARYPPDGSITHAELAGPMETIPVSVQRGPIVEGKPLGSTEASPPKRVSDNWSLTLPLNRLSSGASILNLPVGLHHFTSLSLHFVNGKDRAFSLGDLFWEILPSSRTIVIDNPQSLSIYISSSVGYNPTYTVYFQNDTNQTIQLKGLHLPEALPLSLDPDSFSIQEGVSFKREPFDQPEVEPAPLRVIPQKTDLFPQPVVVPPGHGVTLHFSLAPLNQEARRTLMWVQPVLETGDGKFLLPLAPSMGSGALGYSITELCKLFWEH
ncbi:MAG: hypothetical protein NUV70_09125 [Caldiserica bacterium]|jgi:hypothetical protein|nr:hypothetical protein [Caldisericota bacterium]